jgi:hypothetical protein
MPAFDVVWAWVGRPVVDRAGIKLGTVKEVRCDARAEEPGWAVVNLADIGDDLRLVPVLDAREDGGAIKVSFDRDAVRAAPRVEPDACLEWHEEAELHEHYGLALAGPPPAEDPDDRWEPPGVVSLLERRATAMPEPPVHWWLSRSARCLRGPGRRSTGPLRP